VIVVVFMLLNAVVGGSIVRGIGGGWLMDLACIGSEKKSVIGLHSGNPSVHTLALVLICPESSISAIVCSSNGPSCEPSSTST